MQLQNCFLQLDLRAKDSKKSFKKRKEKQKNKKLDQQFNALVIEIRTILTINGQQRFLTRDCFI